MSKINLEKYPIGNYEEPSSITKEMRSEYSSIIASFPENLKYELVSLTDEKLNTPYRDGGWTIRQVVHHLADSNMSCFSRIKYALTEESPVIKPFEEGVWAILLDAHHFPIEPSLKILEGVHARWAALLDSLDEKDWKRDFFHPQLSKNLKIEEAMAKYTWHCKHHLAHITHTKQKMGWLEHIID
tara:strand:- start:158 stop:712 length:555 start_codon:yes stop_codon:yes gene_type:complete